MAAVHTGQNVHLYEQMKAAPSGVSGASQRSHCPRNSKAIER